MSISPRLACCLALVLPVGACSAESEGPINAFRVNFVGDPARGSVEQPLPFSNDALEYAVTIEALGPGGAVDTGYSGWVALDVRPTGKLERAPILVKLEGGLSNELRVSVRSAYGAVRLVVNDPGLTRVTDREPACDPAHPDPLPAGDPACLSRCNNGKDDDGDGFVDFPGDRGCFNGSDDSETGGVGGGGASPPLHFANPRVADVQEPGFGDASALQGQRATIDRGFLLVTRVGVDGLYITDYDGVQWDGQQFNIDTTELSYRSIFAFNFSTPRNLQEGDCLVQIDGTVDEFFNYTELGKPTWKKGDAAFCAALGFRAGVPECAPRAEGEEEQAYEERLDRCRVALENLANRPVPLTKLMVDVNGQPTSVWEELQTERYESALVQLSNVTLANVAVFEEIRPCDRNDNGVIDYADPEEAQCANDCGDTPGCIVAETYSRYNQWTVTFDDGSEPPKTIELAVVSSGAIPNFDPVKSQGKLLSRIVGTLRHLGFGRPAWILEPRRQADCPDCVND